MHLRSVAGGHQQGASLSAWLHVRRQWLIIAVLAPSLFFGWTVAGRYPQAAAAETCKACPQAVSWRDLAVESLNEMVRSSGDGHNEGPVPAVNRRDEDTTSQDRIVRIGVLANRGEEICLAEWVPTAQYLAAQLAPLRFEIVPLGFTEVQHAVEKHEVEFLLVNSSIYVALEYHALVNRIATFLQPSLKGESPQPVFGGVIFCRADRNDIRVSSDFVGKRFAAVAPTSLGGWHAAWRELSQLEIQPKKDFAELVFCGTHDAVVEAVRTGRVDGGTVRSTQLERMVLEGLIDPGEFRVLRSSLDVPADYPFLLSTRLYPEWPFAAVRGTDLELGKSVASALLRMSPDDPAAKASRGAGWAIPQDYASVHACLRELQLAPYENYGKITVGQAIAQYWGFILAVLAVSVTIFILALSSIRAGFRLKESLMAVRESERKYRSVVENIQDVFYRVDADGRLALLSPSAARMLGYDSVDGLVGQSADVYWADPSKRSAMLRELERTGRVRDWEFEAVCRDGSRLLAATTVHVTHDDHGNPIGYEGIWRNITESKRAERALRESDAFIKAVLENLPIGVAVSRAHPAVEFVYMNDNFPRYYRTTRESLAGPDAFWEAVYEEPEFREEIKRRVLDDCASGDPERMFWADVPITRKGDETTFTTSRNILVPNRQLMISTVWDVTERKQADEERRRLEERLQRAEKMEALGTLAGGVAHDLNNVLGIVVGYSEMLLDDLEESSPERSQAMEILKGGQRAAAIVQDLLTLARRGVPNRRVLNLSHLLMDCQKSPEFEKMCSFHPNVRVKTDLEPDLLNIAGSSVHLCKSFMNLVSNAAEAMAEGGLITIKTRSQYLDMPVLGYDEVKEGDYVVLSVSDEGEGIAPADLKRIFEPFYTKKVMGRSGTGLGLAVVWGTVKDHYGYINVESEEGQGTTFTLYFPVTRKELTPEQISLSASEYMGRGESILVVDDVKEQRELAVAMLKKLNYKVASASSGEEAVEHVKQDAVDLVILDMIMGPGMDGLDTYIEILEIYPGQKAIIVSGFAETERVIEAQSLGAGAYVKKPYVLERLGVAVSEELARTR